MLHTINIKDVVNQNVLLAVGWSFFTFFIISTRLRQNIIAKIGIKYTLMNTNTIIDGTFTSTIIIPNPYIIYLPFIQEFGPLVE